MASSTTSEYPVLKEVIAIVEAFDKQPNPENWDKQCPSKKKHSPDRCRKEIKAPDQKRAKELLVHFKLLKECPATEEFLSQLKDFLHVSHCCHHRDDIMSSFETWRHLHATSSISMTGQSPSNIENNPDDSSLSVDATSILGQATSSTISDPASSESTSPVEDKHSIQVEVLTDGISTLAIASAGINPSDAHDGKREQVQDTGLATEGIPTLAIASASIITDDANDKRRQQMIGLGLVTSSRKKSIQEDCRVLNEIYKDLTAKQTKLGIVYVLRHVKHDGLYKIGWTEKTVKDRLNQPGNCCMFNTTTVYESPGDRFPGAAKVEKLVHEMLRFHNVKVSECDYCGKGHNEWFEAPKEMVLHHIKVMEQFVKLPAYASENGELSGPAYDIVRRITNITPAMIHMAMADIEDLVQAKSETVTEVTEIFVSPDPQDLEDTEGQRPSDEVDVDDREETVGEPKKSAGAKAGRFVKRTKQGVEDKVHRLRPSRKSGEVRSIEEVVDDIFHIMYPQEAQTGKISAGDRVRAGFSQLEKKLKREIKDFREESKR